MFRIGQFRITGFNRTAKHFICPTSIVPEYGDRLWHIFLFSKRERFSIVPSVNGSKNLLLTLAEISKLPKKISTVSRNQTLPRRGLEGLSCCRNCVVDVFWPSRYNIGDCRLIGWIQCRNGTSSLCIDKFVVDEQTFVTSALDFHMPVVDTCRLLKRNSIRSGKLNKVSHIACPRTLACSMTEKLKDMFKVLVLVTVQSRYSPKSEDRALVFVLHSRNRSCDLLLPNTFCILYRERTLNAGAWLEFTPD